MNRGMRIASRSTLIIKNTMFINMKQNIKEGILYFSEIKASGSAIEIIDSDVQIDNSTFKNNIATNGGAISISCNYLERCETIIKNSKFENNTAQNRGGAIIYNSYVPTLVNNTYEGNKALYSKDVESYPVKVKKLVNDTHLEDILVLNNIPSGILIDDPINLAIVNVGEDQIVSSDSKSYIKLVAIEKGTNVKGQNTITLEHGKATFANTIFYASPGKTNVKFRIESSAINKKMTQHLDSAKYTDQIISVNFRWCKPGEIQIENICSPCNTGSYSVKWNETR